MVQWPELLEMFFTEKYLIEFKNFQKFIFALHATDIIIRLQKAKNIIHNKTCKVKVEVNIYII
jgi:hypothetical protein